MVGLCREPIWDFPHSGHHKAALSHPLIHPPPNLSAHSSHVYSFIVTPSVTYVPWSSHYHCVVWLSRLCLPREAAELLDLLVASSSWIFVASTITVLSSW